MCKIVFLHMSGTPATRLRRNKGSVAAQKSQLLSAGRAADFKLSKPSKHNTKDSRLQRPLRKNSELPRLH